MRGAAELARVVVALAVDLAGRRPTRPTSARTPRRRARRATTTVRSTRLTHSMNENVARPMRMSATMVSPMMYEPIVENSVRSTSPKSSPTTPPIGIAPNATALREGDLGERREDEHDHDVAREARDAGDRGLAVEQRRREERELDREEPRRRRRSPRRPRARRRRPTGPTQSAPATSGRVGIAAERQRARAPRRAPRRAAPARPPRGRSRAPRGARAARARSAAGAGTSPGRRPSGRVAGRRGGPACAYLVLLTRTPTGRASPGRRSARFARQSRGEVRAPTRAAAANASVANARKNFEPRRFRAATIAAPLQRTRMARVDRVTIRGPSPRGSSAGRGPPRGARRASPRRCGPGPRVRRSGALLGGRGAGGARRRRVPRQRGRHPPMGEHGARARQAQAPCCCTTSTTTRCASRRRSR